MATKQATKKPAKKAVTATKSRTSTAAKKKTVAAKTKNKAELKSFRVYKSDVPFTNTKPTRQTIYWLIILGVITTAQLIILKIQLDIMELTQPMYM